MQQSLISHEFGLNDFSHTFPLSQIKGKIRSNDLTMIKVGLKKTSIELCVSSGYDIQLHQYLKSSCRISQEILDHELLKPSLSHWNKLVFIVSAHKKASALKKQQNQRRHQSTNNFCLISLRILSQKSSIDSEIMNRTTIGWETSTA